MIYMCIHTREQISPFIGLGKNLSYFMVFEYASNELTNQILSKKYTFNFISQSK